ncbi:MAG TPA: putative porin [Steroidobacteraceae bacterium]|nr:putative porin [Steroidobacteraceae bacterium]
MTRSFSIMPLLLAAALACATARAADYRAELDLSFDNTDPDGPGAPDVDVFGVEGSYYFAPVTTDGKPLAEAAFLNRSGYVGAGAARLDAGDEDFDILAAEVGCYVPGTMFFGRIGVTHVDDLGPGDSTRWNGTFGIAPMDGLLVTTDFDEDGWDPNVRARYVGRFGTGHWYAAGISATDPDDDDPDVGLDVDFFFDETFSVGAGVSDDTRAARIEKFFQPNFAVGARVYEDDDGDGFGATLRWRF